MSTYKKENEEKFRQKTKCLISDMPQDCRNYFLLKESKFSVMTAYAYARDITKFLEYLIRHNSNISRKKINELTADDLDKLNSVDISEFFNSISSKAASTKARYKASLGEFFKYMVHFELIRKNPFEYLNISTESHNVVFLNDHEQILLLSAAETGYGLSRRQLTYHDRNSVRDIAILRILLSTGIRVSELVGLDISDIDFDRHSLTVTRKGYESMTDNVYMSDIAENALKEYLYIRSSYNPGRKDKALFLSFGTKKKRADGVMVTQSGKRVSVRCIQRLVKKYIAGVLPERAEEITVHKLRATFATSMLKKTHGDIERVQKLLGHKNINTTTHYVQSTEEQKAEVRNLQ